MRFIYSFILVLIISSAVLAQATGSLSGQVVDQNGAVIAGVAVTANGNGIEKTATTNRTGEFTITGLPSGAYVVRAKRTNFAVYENTGVVISAGQRKELTITLSIAIAQEEVTVSNENQVNTNPENNKSSLILRGDDIESLPEDPDELAAALQALAGLSAGPNGGQIYIDGFTGGRLPPRESIREIRVNDNPFSAEVDRISYGRIEIFTKPGAEKLQGQLFFNFNDESLNARNPFALNRASSQIRFYGGNISNSIIKNKLSFFLDFDRREFDDNAVVNATVLSTELSPVLFSQAFVVPVRRFSFSPRFDYAGNEKNTLMTRYSFTLNTADNRGVGDLSLPTRSFDTQYNEQSLQVVETAIFSPNIVNETKFQYIRSRNQQQGNNSVPVINVAGSFIGGDSNIGLSFTNEDRFELQNYTNWALEKHDLKFGGRLRGVSVKDRSESNFAGIFTFAGLVGFTSLEQYRQKLLGNSDLRFNPNQFTITAGDALVDVSQVDFGGFVNDDWRIRPNLTLSFGLRYEAQTNLSSNLNFAPRLSFAWSPQAKQPKTVLRGGFGIFYERVSESLSLQENRFDGTRQVQYIVTDPALLGQPVFTLNGVSNVPTAQQIAALVPNSETVRRLAEDLRAPYTVQSAISLEHQLPLRTTLSFTYLATLGFNFLRTRNINAPLCGNICSPGQLQERPFPGQGNIYQFESSGRLDLHQLTVNFRTRLNPNFSIFGNYRLSKIKSDTDGVDTFPAYSYDLSQEYSASSSDARHFLLVGGSFNLPRSVRLGTYITATSGRPFNITTGFDLNEDSLFTERPAFAADLNRPSVRVTRFGAFDLDPLPGQEIIPRNYGRGPASFNVNLNANKTFGFGGGGNSKLTTQRQSGANNNEPYKLTFGVQVFNLFNRTNARIPIGNLSSPRFGESNSLATFGFFNAGGSGGGLSTGSRRITLQVRFSF